MVLKNPEDPEEGKICTLYFDVQDITCCKSVYMHVCLRWIESRFYLEQLFGRASAVHIHLQTAVEEVSEHR